MTEPLRSISDLTDDELMARLRDIDPVPPELYARARTILGRRLSPALELRQTPCPRAGSAGHQLPDGAGASIPPAPPGLQTPGARNGAAGPWASARPASRRRFFALARKAVRALAWLVAGLLLVVAAIGAGFFFGILALLYGGPF
jgi:hypothetical protein